MKFLIKKIDWWLNELNYPLYLAGTINNSLRVWGTSYTILSTTQLICYMTRGSGRHENLKVCVNVNFISDSTKVI